MTRISITSLPESFFTLTSAWPQARLLPSTSVGTGHRRIEAQDAHSLLTQLDGDAKESSGVASRIGALRGEAVAKVFVLGNVSDHQRLTAEDNLVEQRPRVLPIIVR